MIILYGIIAVFIAWIWVDYFRLIDIFEKERLIYFIPAFILGGLAVLSVVALNEIWLSKLNFNVNGEYVNDFLYCFLNIGLLEELAKLLPFIVIYLIFKKQFSEPIDYFVFICISALGFAAVENTMYFNEHGAVILNNRAILSTVGHMFDSSLIAYGIVKYKFQPGKDKIYILGLYFFYAALSHAIYDFFLISDFHPIWGFVMVVIYFFITISLFATTLNNALNNSTYFTYKKVIDSDKVITRLFMYYAILFILQFVILAITKNLQVALSVFIFSMISTGFIIIITVIRLSRFKLIKEKWAPLKLEFPFTISSGEMYGMTSMVKITVKGESFNEVYLNKYYEELFMLNPVSSRKTSLEYARLAYIEAKYYLYDDIVFYLVKIFTGDEHSEFDKILIKPMINGENMISKKYPIVAVLAIKPEEVLDYTKLTKQDMGFMEWAYVKPYSVENIS